MLKIPYRATDDGPLGQLIYSLVSTTAPGTVNVNPVTGEVTWATVKIALIPARSRSV